MSDITEFFPYPVVESPIELPPPVIEQHGTITVVRDDLLAGGTKRRFIYPFLAAQPDVQEWVYASPRVGYAQVAIAYAARDMGLKATIFLPKGKHTELTEEAIGLGANIVEVPMGFLTHIQHASKKYVEQTAGSQLLPFGLDHPMIIDEIARIASKLPVQPKEVWTCISSGVLSRGLQKAWPDATFYGVRVGHGTTERERGRATLFDSKYKFNQKCKEAECPPFPSSRFYDAKTWSFIQENASDGALFWNVGG